MELKIEFIRDESFVIGLMNSIDKKIESCFKLLNEPYSDRLKSCAVDDGAMKVSSVYTSDNEIINSVMKLEKLRNDYFVELQDLKLATIVSNKRSEKHS